MQMQISAETNNHERTVNHHATDILHQQEPTLTSLNFQIGDRRARAQLLLVVGLKKNSLWPSGAKNRVFVMSFEKFLEQRQIMLSVIFSPVFDCRLRAWRQPWNKYLSMLHFLGDFDDQYFYLCQSYS